MTIRRGILRLGAVGLAAAALVIVAVMAGGSTEVAAPPLESPHGSFREDCAFCHRPDAWTPARISDKFDHSKYGFALTGAHKDAPCLQCHQNLEFTTARGSKCADCHQDVHLGEMGPDCARCHSTRDFVDRTEATQIHRATRFPLTGAHLTADCAECHRPVGAASMRFLNTPTTCDGCHLAEYRATSSPDHESAGFPTDCAQCHSTSLWTAGAFDHSTTGFPLTGAHRPLECQQCHAGNKFTPISPLCVSCHRSDYDATTDPNHASVGFSTDCASCHGTASWDGASFDHSTTGFALTGAHQAQSCQACHGSGPITPLDPACVSCHRTQYDATTDPPHASVGFSTDCVTCHGTTSWSGATFNHSTTGFPLTGAHTTQSCQACHVPGGPPPSPLCVSCHQSDYDGTTNPNHASAGFSTDCASCHGTSTWQGATFDHDASFFPIYSGTHAGKWSACIDCHVNQANYSVFECIFCHAHSDRARVDADHNGVSGYQYLSTACYSCHPRGNH